MKRIQQRTWVSVLTWLLLVISVFCIGIPVQAKKKEKQETQYVFRNEKLLNQHYQKHGIEMGFDSAKEYEEAACAVANNPEALHKTEKEDGDDIYYLEETNDFVIVSTDGYIRTYFWPSAGIKYYNRQ